MMTPLQNLTTACLLLLAVGCTSTPRVAVREPVGPSELTARGSGADGSLVVYSARRLANVDAHAESELWNNDSGRNAFLYEPAHTDYTIYKSDGSVFQRVVNAAGGSVETPTRVTLPAGTYTVEADAELHGTVRLPVLVTVAIESGRTTTLELEATSEHAAKRGESESLVRFADGRVIGYRAVSMVGLNGR